MNFVLLSENFRWVGSGLVIITMFPAFFFQGGVQRVHLVDGTIGGVLLLELFQRDGVGTMVARYPIIMEINFQIICFESYDL